MLLTPSAGKKRSRDDDDDGNVAVEWGMRFEKVTLGALPADIREL